MNTTMNTEYKFIYKMSWYESKRHKISHTDMYFQYEKDTRWVYDRVYNDGQWFDITVVRVPINSWEYESAVECSSKCKSAIGNSKKKDNVWSGDYDELKKSYKEVLRDFTRTVKENEELQEEKLELCAENDRINMKWSNDNENFKGIISELEHENKELKEQIDGSFGEVDMSEAHKEGRKSMLEDIMSSDKIMDKEEIVFSGEEFEKLVCNIYQNGV